MIRIKIGKSLKEGGLSRIITDHFQSGFIILSADRTCKAEKNRECTPEEEIEQQAKNEDNLKALKFDIKAAGFGYMPMLGGYKEKTINPETGEEEEVDTEKPERSFLIPATKGGGDNSIDELKELGLKLCVKYNQDSLLFKPPNSIDKKAYFIDKNGNTIMSFDGLKVNDYYEPYYTQLKKKKDKRFSFTE